MSSHSRRNQGYRTSFEKNSTKDFAIDISKSRMDAVEESKQSINDTTNSIVKTHKRDFVENFSETSSKSDKKVLVHIPNMKHLVYATIVTGGAGSQVIKFDNAFYPIEKTVICNSNNKLLVYKGNNRFREIAPKTKYYEIFNTDVDMFAFVEKNILAHKCK